MASRHSLDIVLSSSYLGCSVDRTDADANESTETA